MPVTADPDITREELQLAARNHGFPLESLRWDITPIGLHYLLIHYDIPDLHPDAWCLALRGLVSSPTSFGLEDLRRMPATSVTVTMECAGNGRALLSPRPISQPWLLEAVGTATWTGVRLADLLEEAIVDDSAVEVVFTGADRGVEGGVSQNYARSLPLRECLRPDVILAYEMNGVPLPPQHGFPLRLVVPGWYGMTNVKWLERDRRASANRSTGSRTSAPTGCASDDDDPGEPVTRIVPRSLMQPPGVPDFMTRRRTVEAAPTEISGRAWSGGAPIVAVEVSVDDAASWHRAELGPDRISVRLASLALELGDPRAR